MEAEVFTLCDYAQDYNGKLTIVGTFDTIGSANFPFMQPFCSIAVRLRFSDKEFGKHTCKMVFKDQNGAEFVPQINVPVEVKHSNALGYSTVNLVVGLGNLKFDKPGKFIIELYIDEDWKAGLTLSALAIKRA